MYLSVSPGRVYSTPVDDQLSREEGPKHNGICCKNGRRGSTERLKTPNEIKKKKQKKNVEIKKDKETKRNEYIEEVTKNECVVPNEFERMVERNGNRNCARAVKTCDEYTR